MSYCLVVLILIDDRVEIIWLFVRYFLIRSNSSDFRNHLTALNAFSYILAEMNQPIDVIDLCVAIVKTICEELENNFKVQPAILDRTPHLS